MNLVTAKNGAQYVEVTASTEILPGDVFIPRNNVLRERDGKIDYVDVSPFVKQGDINNCQRVTNQFVAEAQTRQGNTNNKRH